MEEDEHFKIPMDSFEEVRRRVDTLIKETANSKLQGGFSKENLPMGWKLSVSSSNSSGSMALNKSTNSSPAVQLSTITYKQLLERFEQFIIRTRVRLSGNGPSYLHHEYRVSDLLTWFAENLYLQTQHRQTSITKEPYQQAFARFLQLLEDQTGFSIPASITMPASQVVRLLLEWKSEETVKKVAERITGIRQQEVNGGGNTADASEYTFPEDSEENIDFGASKMTKFLCDIGSSLVLEYVGQKSEDGGKEIDGGKLVPETASDLYRCSQPYCKFTSTNIFHLHDHQRQLHRHHGQNYCCFCEFTSRKKTELKRHYRIIHGHASAMLEIKRSNLSCSSCDRRFRKRGAVERHLERGCPLVDAKDVLNIADSDDVLNGQLWPMPKRQRPYWLSMSPLLGKSALEKSWKNSNHERPGKLEFKSSNYSTNPPVQTGLKRSIQDNDNRSAPRRLFASPVIVAKNLATPSSAPSKNIFPKLFSINTSRKSQIRGLLELTKRKQGHGEEKAAVSNNSSIPTHGQQERTSHVQTPPIQPKTKAGTDISTAKTSERIIDSIESVLNCAIAQKRHRELDGSVESVIKRARLSVNATSTGTSAAWAPEVEISTTTSTPQLNRPPVQFMEKPRIMVVQRKDQSTTSVTPAKEEVIVSPVNAPVSVKNSKNMMTDNELTKEITMIDGGTKKAAMGVGIIDVTRSETAVRSKNELIGSSGKPQDRIQHTGAEKIVEKKPSSTPVYILQTKPIFCTKSSSILVNRTDHNGSMAKAHQTVVGSIVHNYALPNSASVTSSSTLEITETPKIASTPANPGMKIRQPTLNKWVDRQSFTNNIVQKREPCKDQSRLLLRYSCDICEAKFITSVAATKHLQIHLKPTSVPLCRVDLCGQCKKEDVEKKNPPSTTVQFQPMPVLKPFWIPLCRVDACGKCSSGIKSENKMETAGSKEIKMKQRQSMSSIPKKQEKKKPATKISI